jgi:hypothetical protein
MDVCLTLVNCILIYVTYEPYLLRILRTAWWNKFYTLAVHGRKLVLSGAVSSALRLVIMYFWLN